MGCRRSIGLEGSVDAVVQAQPALTFNKEEVRPKGDLAGALAKDLGGGLEPGRKAQALPELQGTCTLLIAATC
jgi:hypothetical protein